MTTFLIYSLFSGFYYLFVVSKATWPIILQTLPSHMLMIGMIKMHHHLHHDEGLVPLLHLLHCHHHHHHQVHHAGYGPPVGFMRCDVGPRPLWKDNSFYEKTAQSVSTCIVGNCFKRIIPLPLANCYYFGLIASSLCHHDQHHNDHHHTKITPLPSIWAILVNLCEIRVCMKLF